MTKLDPNRGSGEDRLIAKYFRPLAQHPGAFGLIDDAAVLTPPAGHDLVLTTDGVIAGVHVFAGDPANAIARRALRVNLPLSILADARPLEEKNAWLHEWLRTKMARREIRYYAESTMLFDE